MGFKSKKERTAFICLNIFGAPPTWIIAYVFFNWYGLGQILNFKKVKNMVFTIEEIKNYLATQKTIEDAVKNINEQSVADCIKIDDFLSLNYIKNKENLLKYEMSIGMKTRKEEQIALRINTNGKQGKQWMACSPRWIENEDHKKDTKYEISYWVNYGDDMTYGWFTVEQIIKWFDNPNIFLHELGGTKER